MKSICALVVLMMLCAAWLPGQTVSTQILGTVTDSTGAVIPGATVTAQKTETGDVRTTTTNATGNFIFPLLDIGTYEVTCSFEGFKTEVRRDIVLQLQDKARINFQLQVGQQVEVIEVTGAQPLLKTEDATLGSVVDQKRVVDLPVNGRNFAQLATLMPGVTYGVSRMRANGQGTIGVRAMPGQMTGLQGPGQRDINQNITLDGAVAVDAHKNAMLFIPSLDAVQEFKIQSAIYSAEFGMNSGVQANVIVKSGGNEIHGSAFEFLRNDQLDARNFFLSPTADKAKLRKNQFGGVVSGPFVKDKTFWMASYEGRRERRSSAASTTVPTQAMRAGDFSEIVQPGNRWYSDPQNRTISLPGEDTPFPNNIIPQSLINPVSQNILTWQNTSPFSQGGFMPFPNFDEQARATGSTVNLFGTNDQNLDSDQYLTRVDHRFGDSDRIFGRYLLVESTWGVNNLDRVSKFDSDYRGQNLAFGWSKIVNPSTVNEFRFGWMRFKALTSGAQTEAGFSQRELGLNFQVFDSLTGSSRQLTDFEEGLPDIGISGFQGINSGRISLGLSSMYEVSDNVTITRGKHNFKFGGLHQWAVVDFGGSNNPRGSTEFTRDIDGIPDGFAAFMLGYPLNTRSAEGFPLGFMRQRKAGFYFLDDYKATPKLTINFGVRWDIFGVVDDADGRIRSLNFEDGIAPVIDGVTVPVLYPDPNVRAPLYEIPWTQIMPRLGIAYRLTDTLVLRTGAGQFYAPIQTNTFSILSLNPPFSGSIIFQQEDNANPTITIDNPFAGAQRAPGPAALIMAGHLQADQGNRSNFKGNDVWQWNMELEKSLGQDMVAGLAYLGSAGSNLDIPIQNSNNPNPGPGSVQARRPIPFYVDSRDTSTLLPVSTVRRLESSMSSNYNALQARFEKRYSKGVSFNASFNYQKHMGIGFSSNESGTGVGPRQTQNPRDYQADYGRYNTDQRFRFVFSHIWEIPWMRNAGGVKGAVLGGWAVNGIIQLASGFPVTLDQSGDSLNTGSRRRPRPHLLPGAEISRVWDNRSIQEWFPTDAFVRSKYEGRSGPGLFLGPLGYGNTGVSLFDMPGQKTWDFALFKEFRITERQKLQFRWESFNFLNTPQFNAPNRQFGNSRFGRITSTIVNNREMQFGLKYIF